MKCQARDSTSPSLKPGASAAPSSSQSSAPADPKDAANDAEQPELPLKGNDVAGLPMLQGAQQLLQQQLQNMQYATEAELRERRKEVKVSLFHIACIGVSSTLNFKFSILIPPLCQETNILKENGAHFCRHMHLDLLCPDAMPIISSLHAHIRTCPAIHIK